MDDDFQAFLIAGMSLFAVRYASPRIARGEEIEQVEREKLTPLAHLVNMYLLAGPVSFEPPVQGVYHGSATIPIMLRAVGNQFIPPKTKRGWPLAPPPEYAHQPGLPLVFKY